MNSRLIVSALSLALAALFLPQTPCRAESTAQINPTAPMPVITAEQRGDLDMARQQYLAAIEAYRQAPVSAVTLNKMGIAYNHLLALDEARKDYEKALLIRPNYPEALNNLGATDFMEKHYKRAVQLYRKALKMMPDSAVIAANLGTAYFAEGKYHSGIEAYQTAFRIDPKVFDTDSPSILPGPADSRERAQQDYCIAELYAETGNQALAIFYLRRAFNDGFKDQGRLMQDTDFAHLRQTAEFAQLMAEEKVH
jgi:tetratricopeptide (TPR) repeat protein